MSKILLIISILLLGSMPVLADVLGAACAVDGALNTQPGDSPVQANSDNMVFLEVTLEQNESVTGGIVAPPPGIYPFHRGDHVVLHAYASKNDDAIPVWSGDRSEEGQTLYVILDEDISVSVRFAPRAVTLERAPASWFDVPVDTPVYAFLGGGNLYGWFVGKRDKDVGSGIMGLTHRDRLWQPMVPLLGLNFEHIFSENPADAYRAQYTPRTDAMQFLVQGPGAIEIYWPHYKAAWDLDCRMTCFFAEDDAIDITFSTVPGESLAEVENLFFMWATYNNQSNDRALYFLGVTPDGDGWQRFGPVADEGMISGGGSIAYHGAQHRNTHIEQDRGNLSISNKLFFSVPLYYGLLDSDSGIKCSFSDMAIAFMFDQHLPILFTLWNWGNPPTISAWDWQYVLRKPSAHTQYGYRARMLLTPFESKSRLLNHYHAWRKEAAETTEEYSVIENWPESPMYWSPRMSQWNAVTFGRYLEATQPSHAVNAYRLALLNCDFRDVAAEAIDRLYAAREDSEGLIREWSRLMERHDFDATPIVHLGRAQLAAGDLEQAYHTFSLGLASFPDDSRLHHHLGRLMFQKGDTDAGFEFYSAAVECEPGLASSLSSELANLSNEACASGDIEKAEQLCRFAMFLAPNDLYLTVHLGETLEKLGRDEEALSCYLDVLRAAPESPHTARNLDALLDRCGRSAERPDIWSKILAVHPESIVPALNLGIAIFDSGDLAGCLPVFQRLAEVVPDRAEVHLYLGASLIGLGELKQGNSQLKQALALDASLFSAAGGMVSRFADEAFLREEYSRAEMLYRTALALVPNDPHHSDHLAKTLEKLEREEEALPIYIDVLRAVPESPYTARNLDALLDRCDRSAERPRIWSEILAVHPESILPALHLGIARFDSGDFAGCLPVFQHLAEAAPDHALVHLYLGATLIGLGEVEQGNARLKQALVQDASLSSAAGGMVSRLAETAFLQEAYVRAATLYQVALTFAPNDLYHAVNLGEALEKLGRNEEALPIYIDVLRAVPESPYTARNLDALLDRCDRSAERPDIWAKILAVHPESILPALHLGIAIFDSGDLEECLPVFQRLAEAAPDYALVHLYLGVTMIGLGQETAGHARLEQVLAQDPSLSSAAGGMVSRFAEEAALKKDFHRAEALYRAALVLAPSDLYHAVHLGETLEKLGRNEEALSCYLDVLRAAPESPHTARNLDTLLDRCGRTAERPGIWSEILAVHPESIIPALHLGMAGFDLGDLAGCLPVFQRLAEVAPDHAMVHLYLGATLIGLGEVEQGSARLEQALAQDPSLSSAAAAVKADINHAEQTEVKTTKE